MDPLSIMFKSNVPMLSGPMSFPHPPTRGHALAFNFQHLLLMFVPFGVVRHAKGRHSVIFVAMEQSGQHKHAAATAFMLLLLHSVKCPGIRGKHYCTNFALKHTLHVSFAFSTSSNASVNLCVKSVGMGM